MGAVFQLSTLLEFVIVSPCCTCGVEMALTTQMEKQRRLDHAAFYCPNGHGQSYPGKSKEEKLAEELAAATARAERAEKLQWEAEKLQREANEQARREVAAARGQVTKIKNRVGNGVCPCCNRSFSNLQRHMHTKHPGFAHDTEAPAPTGAA